MEHAKDQGAVSEFHLPEWETSERQRKPKPVPTAGQDLRNRASEHFNRVLPAHRKYCGLSRKTAIVVASAILLVLFALIVGLAAGLSHRSGYVPCQVPKFRHAEHHLQHEQVASVGFTNLYGRLDVLRDWTGRLRSDSIG